MLVDLKWYLVLRGVIALLLGGFALFAPDLSIGVLVTIVGIFCLLDGAFGLGFSLRVNEAREYRAVSIASFILGVVLVIWSTGAVKFLLMIFGAWLVFVGGGQIISARRMPINNANRGVMLVFGAVAALVGLVLIVWPGTGIVVVSWGIAAAAILVGIQSLYLASVAGKAGR